MMVAVMNNPKGSRTAGGQEEAPRFAGDDERWDAVVRHDRDADGIFWYSVASTGVYCRPSCAGRRPRRENVRFHSRRAEAEQAGFRPCKRCRPNEPALYERQAAAVAEACRAIDVAEEVPSLAALAAAAGISRFHFHRLFKAHTGLTPKAYADARRAGRVRDGLPRTATVTDAIYDAGFNSNGRFYAKSTGLLGMTPTAYRSGGGGALIRFAVGQCWLGAILVAATEKGVCAITFGDDPDALVSDLQDRFPNARFAGGEDDFEHWVAAVVGFVERPSGGLDLPLDVRGSAFQLRVWQALREIPIGSTASYAEIATSIGRPGAARAVGHACATNPLAVAIPCHRVVRGDGGLGGYRWGLERKRALQKREAS
jgi:AraC family transcriptional regulator of adaptative response/methylated-DNA-[protein]-cysteine methyltransferase